MSDGFWHLIMAAVIMGGLLLLSNGVVSEHKAVNDRITDLEFRIDTMEQLHGR